MDKSFVLVTTVPEMKEIVRRIIYLVAFKCSTYNLHRSIKGNIN